MAEKSETSIRPAWRVAADRIAGTFLTGLLFLLPVILTLMIIDWLARQIGDVFGPDTLIGSALTSGGGFIFGDESLGFWLLLAIIVVGIWGFGFAFGERARRSLNRRMDAFVDRIPVLRHIYKPIAQVVRMIGMKEDNQFATMRPVSVRLGDDVEMLALQVSANTYRVGMRDMVLVLVPTAPVPVGGALMFVVPEAVEPVDGMGVEELMTFYVSMGTMAPSLANEKLAKRKRK